FVETLWGIGFLSVLPLAIIQLRRAFSITDKETRERLRILRYSAIIIATWCLVYCMYRWVFTLPGMWSRVLANRIAEDDYVHVTGIQAIINALGWRTRTSLEYRDFGFFGLIWFSSYFSILTWISLFLMQAPRPREISGKQKSKLPLITLVLITLGLIALIILIGLPADLDEKIILLILGGVFLVPIVYFFVLETKRVKVDTIT
ncbi:MAG: hypothetical protein ACTSYI_00450, partial [Promethearchaeota archaeon]